MQRSVGPGLLAVVLLLGACTGGSPVGSTGAPRADGVASSQGDSAATASGSATDADGRTDDEDEASGDEAEATTETAAPSPSPEPTFADAALILRDDEGFDESTVAAVEALDGLAGLGGSRNDEVSLWSSTAADGAALDSFPEGFRVLVTALVDTADLPGPRLERGEALLTPRGAELRDGLGVGGSVALGPDRTTLAVAAVADDQEPYGSAELVLHPDDGDAVALEPLDRLFLRFDEGVDVEAAAEEVRALLGTDEPRAVEVRDLTPGRGRRTLSVSEAKQQFGEFAFRDLSGTRDIDQEQAWVDANITREQVPLLGTIRCHRLIFDDLRAALVEIIDAGLGGWADPSRFGGCWYPRRIGEGDGVSKHAWGIALDVNVDFSVPGGGEVPPDGVIEAFRRNGFSWGGDFPRPDNHHFEWVGDEA